MVEQSILINHAFFYYLLIVQFNSVCYSYINLGEKVSI